MPSTPFPRFPSGAFPTPAQAAVGIVPERCSSGTSRRILLAVSDRVGRLERAFAALDAGDGSGFRDLFAEDARWLGVPGSGIDGATPV
jgi:hypothetical protein